MPVFVQNNKLSTEVSLLTYSCEKSSSSLTLWKLVRFSAILWATSNEESYLIGLDSCYRSSFFNLLGHFDAIQSFNRLPYQI